MVNHKLARKIAVFFLRAGRGQGLISRVVDPVKDVLDGTVYIFALKGLFGIEISIYLLAGIVIAKKILEQFIAWMDEKKWGFWRAENYYSSNELSPFNQELMKTAKSNEEKLDILLRR